MSHKYTNRNYQSAHNAQIYGPVQAAEEKRKERITWIWLGVTGFITGCVLFLACVADLPGAGA